jgi:hypothetical protein
MTTKPTTYTYAVTLPCGKVSTLISRRIYKFAVIGFCKYYNHYTILSHNFERKHAEAVARKHINSATTCVSEIQIVSL